MPRTTQLLGKSVIASTDSAGATAGNPVPGAAHTMLGIQTPTELVGNCYLEAGFVKDSVDPADWRRVQCYGLDVALPANRFVIVDAVAAPYLRAISDVPEFSDREFVFWNILDI